MMKEMKMNFKKLSHEGGSFIASASIWDDYKRWLQTEAACKHCGRLFKDRPTDENGRPKVWNTETDCGCRNK